MTQTLREPREPDASDSAEGGAGVNDDRDSVESGAREQFTLYYSPWCGYCLRVLAVIQIHHLDVDCVNVRKSPERLQELIDATGRRTVPVLRITGADGIHRWLPESRDIGRYLREHARP